MSTPILPFAVWESGTNQNSIPANDNSLRNQMLNGLVISDSTDAQPGSPADGDIYIMTGAASGTQWATFDEFDLAIFDSGTWYAYAPVDGVVVNLAGVLKRWNGTAYVDAATGGGGIASVGAGHGVDVDATDPDNPIVAVYETELDPSAIPFSNSGFSSTNVEDAIVEAQAGGGGADRTTVTALSISSGVVNIDCALGDFFTLLLNANVTSITFSNLPASGKGAALAVRVRQDGTGSRTMALPASFKATGGSDVAVQSAANAYTMLTLTTFDQGTRWEYAMQEIAA